MLNNEQIGISAEVAIANVFNVPVQELYRARSVDSIVDSIEPFVPDIFQTNNVPIPVEHTAERQNPVDFKLEQGKTLSVKTNKQALGKIAPQVIGQTSSTTWFNQLSSELEITNIPTTYTEKVILFKHLALTKIEKLLTLYWQHTFSCDYLICIYDVVDAQDVPTNHPEYTVFSKYESPVWETDKITFTRPSVEEWNESCTVKYNNVAIGEFQIHNHRDNFKFRFNMAGIVRLINSGQITLS